MAIELRTEPRAWAGRAWWNRVAPAATLATALIGCAGSATPPSPSSDKSTASVAVTVSAVPGSPSSIVASPSAGPSASAQPSASAAAPFESTSYPYALALPPGVITRNWRAATVPWDGQTRVGTDTPNVDTTGTVHGPMLAWGLPWEGDVAGFLGLVRDTMGRFHGCSAVSEPQSFDVGGVAGLGQRERCALDTNTQSIVLVDDGYGLVFRVQINPGKESVIFRDLVSWVDGLTWRAR